MRSPGGFSAALALLALLAGLLAWAGLSQAQGQSYRVFLPHVSSASAPTPTPTATPTVIPCYKLTVSVANNGGFIAVNTPENCVGGYTAGTVVSLTAIPSAGWDFLRWAGDASGTSSDNSIIMGSNKSVVAWFILLWPTTPGPCPLNVQVLKNTSFEHWEFTGSSLKPQDWQVGSFSIYRTDTPQLSSRYAKTGALSALFGRSTNWKWEGIYQTITVPPWAETANLKFSWRLYSYADNNLASAVLTVEVSRTFRQVWNYNANKGTWVDESMSFDVADKRGQPINVEVGSWKSSVYTTTYWYVDDVELQFSCP